jgi:hypothetical protein
VRAQSYGQDVLSSRRRRKVPEVTAEIGMVVEVAGSEFCGAVVRFEREGAVLADRRGRERFFPFRPASFLLEGEVVTMVAPRTPAPSTPARSASGSVRVGGLRARTAREGRIWVEGKHDAELVERVWGHDLRVEGVVVEELDGVDVLAERLAGFGTGPARRVGVLVAHLVAGSKESRIVEALDDEHTMVTGHPYVDIWQAVRPAAVGIEAWPTVPRGRPWKEGVCAALGWGESYEGWQRILGSVGSFRDLEPSLIGSVERLIDFVTEPPEGHG